LVDRLHGRRLINIKDSGDGELAYSIHRLLQQRVRLDMDDYNYANALRRAFRLLRKQLPKADTQQVPEPTDLESSMKVMNHVYSFYQVLEKRPPKSSMVEPQPAELAEFFYDAGFYLWGGQAYAYDGVSFLEAAERILDTTGADANAKIRADIHCIIGLLLLNLGCEDRVRGSERLRMAWQIRRVIFLDQNTEDNEVLLQNAAVDYSLCLMNEHRFEEARPIYQECRERYEKWGGEPKNPFEFGKYYGNTSILLMAEGKLDEAIWSVKRSIELTEKFSGKKWMYYRRVFLLACLLLQAGQTQNALEMHLEALSARQEIHGMHHENTILSTYAVGATYHYLGRPAKAM
jgi:tetratricopeptide (TPR) repeat protein